MYIGIRFTTVPISVYDARMRLWKWDVKYLDALFESRPEMLSVQEVAELLGMTKPGIYKWIKDGVIPAYKVGSSWFILRDELKEMLRSGANVAQPDDR